MPTVDEISKCFFLVETRIKIIDSSLYTYHDVLPPDVGFVFYITWYSDWQYNYRKFEPRYFYCRTQTTAHIFVLKIEHQYPNIYKITYLIIQQPVSVTLIICMYNMHTIIYVYLYLYSTHYLNILVEK